MNCSKFEELIEQYLDDSLTEELKIEFENHISVCNSCKDSFNFSKEIRSTLHDFPLISVPEDFSANLNKRLDEELTKEHRTQRRFRIPAKYYGVAACALLAVALNMNSSDLFLKSPDLEQNAVVSPDVQSTENPVEKDNVSETTESPEIAAAPIPTSAPVVSEQAKTEKPAQKAVKEKKVSSQKKPNQAKSASAITSEAVITPEILPTQSPEPVVDREIVEKVKEKIDDHKYTGRVVIASAVEQACVIDEESVTKMADEIDYRKSYTLLKEAAENKSIASVSTMEQLKNVEIVNNDIIYNLNHDGTSDTGAVGNSVIVYKRDAEKINDILHKYYTRECGEFYVISDAEYEQFLLELEENGINYTKSGANKSSTNDIMFKLVIA